MTKRFLVGLVALSLLLSACSGAGGGDEGDGGLLDTRTDDEGLEVQEGGVVVFGAEQEPNILNSALADGNSFWTQTILENLLPDSYAIMPDFSYVPEVLAEEAEVSNDPFTVTYRIKEEAVWNDGKPVSAEDFVFTWQTYTDRANDIVDRTGYTLIDRAEIIDPKTVRFIYKRPFAGYKDIFDDILPKHELEGKNFNQVWNEEITLSAGPFEFKEWRHGDQLTLVRNEKYWGEHLAYLDEVIFRFITDTNSEIQALRGREVDTIYPTPQLQLADVATMPEIEVQSSAGGFWEHLDFQLDNPILAKQFVREAIAHGIDRQGFVDQFIKDLYPEASVLENVMYVSNQAEYEPHFQIWDYDPQESIRILEENGCKKDEDGVYVCDGDRLEFGFTTTAGNELRELHFEAIQEQLKAVGIELNSEIGPADVVFGRTFTAKQWDMFLFGWTQTPEPSGGVAVYSCGGSNNFQTYCNEEVTDLLDKSNSELDPEARAELFNQADDLVAQDVPTLPLYQKPTFLAYQSYVHGMEDNATAEGPTWNIGEWWVESR